jgi:NADH dehydrogenase
MSQASSGGEQPSDAHGANQPSPGSIATDRASKPRIVIIGGGFGGVACAKRLHRLLPSDKYDLVVFNRENHMVFHPLLAELAAAVVQPKDVGAPMRELLKGVHCRREEVLDILPAKSELVYEADDGRRRTMGYDHLVIACGSEVNLGAVPGMADHAFPLKSIGDAMWLQGHVIDQLERADVCENAERRRFYTTFIVIGAGFSGVEVAGELNDLIRKSRKYYGNIAEKDLSVILIHSGEQILPEVSPSLREFAAKKMAATGVDIRLNARVSVCTQEGVRLSSGELITGGTVVCTVGTSPHMLVQHLTVAKERGRLLTEVDMSLKEYPNIWAIGDCAAIVNAEDGKLSPPTAQFAERQAKQVAENIARKLKGEQTHPFSHKSLGSLCAIGGHSAVAEMMGLRVSGIAAWFCWRGVYLMKLPSFSQKVKVGIEWMLDLVLPRPLAHLRNDRTNRVSRSFFPSGDYIFREGDPAADFYMIENGEVEVLQPVNGAYEPIAILGAGDFFGERALIDHRPRVRACRARTDVELVVLGSNLFNHISKSLSPLKKAVASAVQRRTAIWQQLPDLREILDQISLSDHIEPITIDPLHEFSSVEKAVSLMYEKRMDVVFVVDDRQQLIGVVTRTDLLRAMEVAATLPHNRRATLHVKDIMVREPIALTPSDTTTFAVSTMREHGLNKVPVVASQTERALKGYVRIENILHSVVQQIHTHRATLN